MSSCQNSFQHRVHPEDAVDDLVQMYGVFKEPGPALSQIDGKPEEIGLLDAFERQIELLKSRSQDFGDCQITIYDKALLVLSEKAETTANFGALELFLIRYLGVYSDSVKEAPGIVESHSRLRNTLIKPSVSDIGASEISAPVHSAAIEATKSNRRNRRRRASRYRPGRPSRKSTDTRQDLRRDDPQVHEKIQRMLDVFYQAKDEYYTREQSRETVRFLRDTTENIINYLCSYGMHDHDLMPELQYFFDLAVDKAIELANGRRRRFENEYQYGYGHSMKRQRRS